jgi:hypothetical protein
MSLSVSLLHLSSTLDCSFRIPFQFSKTIPTSSQSSLWSSQPILPNNHSSDLLTFSTKLTYPLSLLDRMVSWVTCASLFLNTQVSTPFHLLHLHSSSHAHHLLVVEAKIDDAPDDLRLHNPFPELLNFADSINLKSCDEGQHGHIPFVVLLIKFLKEWQDKNGGKSPSTTAEKNEFKKYVSSRARKPGLEDNFLQAAANAFKLYASKAVSILTSSLRFLFLFLFLVSILTHCFSSFWSPVALK